MRKMDRVKGETANMPGRGEQKQGDGLSLTTRTGADMHGELPSGRGHTRETTGGKNRGSMGGGKVW